MCEVKPISKQSVIVADGNKILCQHMCKNFTWSINVKQFVNDVLLIQIGSCDMVFGIQWLNKLGEVHWDFHNMIMKFEVEGQTICLKGVTNNTRVHVVKEISSKNSCDAIQLCLLQVTDNKNITPSFLMQHLVETPKEAESLELTQLKTFFKYVFQDPSVLPPSRGHFDHRIPTKPHALPVSIRLY